jgi:hypothetical protein
MRKAVIVGAVLTCLLATSRTTLAGSDHDGLVGMTCAWVDASSTTPGPDLGPVFRETLRSGMPNLKIDQKCPSSILLVMESLGTESKSATAMNLGIEVTREVLLPSSGGTIPIRAVVWRKSYQWVASGPRDDGKVLAAIKQMMSDLYTSLRDDMSLAGNKP